MCVCVVRFVKCRGIQFAAPVVREKPQQFGHAVLWGSKQLSLAYSAQYAQYNGQNRAILSTTYRLRFKLNWLLDRPPARCQAIRKIWWNTVDIMLNGF